MNLLTIMLSISMSIVTFTVYGCESPHDDTATQETYGTAGNVPEQHEPKTILYRINHMFDRGTAWLNPFFETPLCSVPGIHAIYPTCKGYVKGLTIAGIIVLLFRSKPMQYVVKTIKEWYESSEDSFIRMHYHEECHHPCLICSMDTKK